MFVNGGSHLQLVAGVHCQFAALISILPVTLLHTPVNKLNEPPPILLLLKNH